MLGFYSIRKLIEAKKIDGVDGDDRDSSGGLSG